MSRKTPPPAETIGLAVYTTPCGAAAQVDVLIEDPETEQELARILRENVCGSTRVVLVEKKGTTP